MKERKPSRPYGKRSAILVHNRRTYLPEKLIDQVEAILGYIIIHALILMAGFDKWFLKPIREAKIHNDPKQFIIGKEKAKRLLENDSIFIIFAYMDGMSKKDEASAFELGLLDYFSKNKESVDNHPDNNYNILPLIDINLDKHNVRVAFYNQ